MLRQRNVPKRRPAVCDPFASLRGNLGCSCAGCAVELTARLRRSVQTTTASQLTKRVCPAAHPPPRALRASGASRRVGSKQQGRLSFGYVSLLRQRNVPKATLLSATPSLRCGATWGARARGAPWNSLRACGSVQTTTASQLTKRVCPAAHPPPRALRASGASRRGGGANNRVAFLLGTFLCFAKETYPKRPLLSATPSLRCGATWGARARGAPWNSLRACGAPFKQPRRVS